jgi:hypothetical protein
MQARGACTHDACSADADADADADAEIQAKFASFTHYAASRRSGTHRKAIGLTPFRTVRKRRTIPHR